MRVFLIEIDFDFHIFHSVGTQHKIAGKEIEQENQISDDNTQCNNRDSTIAGGQQRSNSAHSSPIQSTIEKESEGKESQIKNV